MVDSSESIGPDNFSVIKNFVNFIVDHVPIGLNAARVGVVLYSHISKVEVSLEEEAIRDEIKSKVLSMDYLGEGTFTGTAIQRANQVFKVARPAVNKVAIIITDGQADPRDRVNLESAVREAQGNNVEMFVIGAVKETHPQYEDIKKEFNLIASDPDTDHVYLIDEFKKLPGDHLMIS